MKTLPLLASLAVTTAVSAAELKDPAAVAREWNQTIEQAKEPMPPPLSLKETLTPKPLGPAPIFELRTDGPPRPRKSVPGSPFFGPRYDAPRNQPPKELPDNLPPGAKLWEFNGQKFWLIPLGPEAGK